MPKSGPHAPELLDQSDGTWTLTVDEDKTVTATFTQKAGVAALKGDKKPVKAMRDEFRRRRDAIVAGLRKIPGFSCPQPKGAFYVFPNASSVGVPAEELSYRFLEEGHVLVFPGYNPGFVHACPG